LYASIGWRHLFINLSLTLSSAFRILRDLRRKRLYGRLMPLKSAPNPDKYGKKDELNAVGAPRAYSVTVKLKR
jgi:ribosome biogenesis protein Tsr3